MAAWVILRMTNLRWRRRSASGLLAQALANASGGSISSRSTPRGARSSPSHLATTAVAMLLPIDVGRRAPHVEELVDAQDQQQAGFRQAEHRQHGGDHHQRGARHAGDALAAHISTAAGDLLCRATDRCHRPAR